MMILKFSLGSTQQNLQKSEIFFAKYEKNSKFEMTTQRIKKKQAG